MYAICSLPMTDAQPAAIAAWIQGHWAIQNQLHWVRDVVFDDYAAFAVMPTGGRDRLAGRAGWLRWSA